MKTSKQELIFKVSAELCSVEPFSEEVAVEDGWEFTVVVWPG